MYPIDREEQRLLNEVNEKYLPRRIAMGAGALVLAAVVSLLGLKQLEDNSAQEEVQHVTCQFGVEANGLYRPDFDTTATLRPDQKIEKGVAACDSELPGGEYFVDINGQSTCRVLDRRTIRLRGADAVHPADAYLVLADCSRQSD